MFAASKTKQVSSAAVFVEDVMSTYLYTGNGSTQTITNGIDLAGKGGLVWIKERLNASNHLLFDTQRTLSARLSSNLTNAELVLSNAITAFNSNGFSVGASGATNAVDSYVSWTFRKQPKFFDIVTYTGNGTQPRTITHNLGSVPGCIIVKRTDSTSDWAVYHRAVDATNPEGYRLELNTTNQRIATSTTWNNQAPTSTEFYIGSATYNASGGTYVAYLFAHNAGGFGLTGTDNVISCGSFTTDGSGNATVNLGYEPQWLLQKTSSSTGSWIMADTMRGFVATAGSNNRLFANTSAAETTGSTVPGQPTATGFIASGDPSTTYIYIAIRRGPMKTPTSGTSVFYPQAVAQADSPDSTNVPFPPDLINTFSRDGTNRTNKFSYFQFVDRLRGAGVPNNTRVAASEGKGLVSSGTDAEYGQANPPGFTYVQLKANSQDITRGTGWNSASYGNWIYYFMRRAPGFFDEVCYTGTGGITTISHNLGVVPELMIVKCRSAAASYWTVYSQPTGNTNYLYLDSTNASASFSAYWNNTTPTASVFTLGAGNGNDTNASGATYVAYLFATVAGVSKVGSYTGTGALQTINCGFTSGARFVLIKRTDSTGDWWVYDSARGITSGNDPYFFMNSPADEVTGTNYVDTDTTGFKVTAAAPAGLNASGGTYIFLAIA